jgi:DNA-binding NarL/FixJ family response regulator
VSEAGAGGYLTKSSTTTELVNAIHTAHKGKTVLAPIAARDLIHRAVDDAHSSVDDLTKREIEILILLAKGLSNNEIAKSHVLVPIQ